MSICWYHISSIGLLDNPFFQPIDLIQNWFRTSTSNTCILFNAVTVIPYFAYIFCKDFAIEYYEKPVWGYYSKLKQYEYMELTNRCDSKIAYLMPCNDFKSIWFNLHLLVSAIWTTWPAILWASRKGICLQIH